MHQEELNQSIQQQVVLLKHPKELYWAQKTKVLLQETLQVLMAETRLAVYRGLRVLQGSAWQVGGLTRRRQSLTMRKNGRAETTYGTGERTL